MWNQFLHLGANYILEKFQFICLFCNFRQIFMLTLLFQINSISNNVCKKFNAIEIIMLMYFAESCSKLDWLFLLPFCRTALTPCTRGRSLSSCCCFYYPTWFTSQSSSAQFSGVKSESLLSFFLSFLLFHFYLLHIKASLISYLMHKNLIS